METISDAASRMSPSATAQFALVARAIAWLSERRHAQPSLAELATALGTSESSLQRTFSAFAGISPKRFLQYLTKEHARALLFDSQDVLSAALASGLSGPSRLHDLLVSTEAMTPGEIGRLGAGVRLSYGYVETPLGRALAATTERGLAFLGFVDDEGGDEAALADLRSRWPRAALQADAEVAARLAGLMPHWRADRPLHLVLAGTNFQIKVWEALLAIPEGKVVSYTQLARAVGRPDAVRAVASAVGRNPISVLIPCHRVIRESGDLGGYHWGLPRKITLLAMETARAQQRSQHPAPAMA